jgi:hypothetical protein
LHLEPYSDVTLSQIEPLLRGAVPQIRDLAIVLNSGVLDTEQIETGTLEALRLGPVGGKTLRALTSPACANLKALRLEFTDDTDPAMVRPILEGALPNLTALGLGLIAAENWLDPLLGSAILPRLESLTLFEPEVAALVRAAPRLSHLKQLRLYFSEYDELDDKTKRTIKNLDKLLPIELIDHYA